MRTARALLLLALFLLPAAGHAGEQALKSLLPAQSNTLAVIPDSYLYVQGNDLTQIYDGGYQRYLRAGVTEVVQQLYRGPGGLTLTVTIHGLATAAAATAFFQAQRKQVPKEVPVRPAAQGRGFTYLAAGVKYGVVAGPRLVAVLSGYGGQPGDRAQLEQVLAGIAARSRPPKARTG